jgi:lipoprotein-anchoring transpeptidase ErfK/SrfK
VAAAVVLGVCVGTAAAVAGDGTADPPGTVVPAAPASDAGTPPSLAQSPSRTAEPSTSDAQEAPAAATTTTTPDATRSLLRQGDVGPDVAQLQARLVEQGYWLGDQDGTFGDVTYHAVMAFQKAEGLPRDGVAGPETLEALAVSGRLSPRTTGGDALEVDLQRQLVLVVRGGRVQWALDTSTGKPATPTPPGRFRVERGVDGVDHGPLGTLYRPAYFNGGIAFHGYPQVPPDAASHGCVRVTNAAMDMLWSTGATNVGTAVWVY